MANLGAILPFLKLLASPDEGLKFLGPLAGPLLNLPTQHLLLFLGLGFIAVVVVSSLLRVATIHLQLRLGGLIALDLGDQVFQAVLARPYSWHLQNNSSKILAHLTNDVSQAYVSIQAFLVVVVNLCIVLLLGAALISLSPVVMGLVSILLAGFYLMVFRLTRRSLQINGVAYTVNYQASLKVAQEGLGGIRDVLIDRTQGYFLEAYHQRQRLFRLAFASINIQAQVPRYLIEGFAVILIVALSLFLAMSGEGIERQLPLLGTLVLGAYRLLQPLQQCFAALGSIQAYQASINILGPFLSNTHYLADVQPPAPAPGFHSDKTSPIVQFQNLSFRYQPDGPLVLKNVELSVYSGEHLAFVGGTGSGKSTCSDLILGLLAPSTGSMFAGGADLHATPGLLQSWQTKVAHVPQHIYLSDASFTANIAFGIPNDQIDTHRVRYAAEQARIAELIDSSPDGYATLVGERGVRLSGGQRQRIGIARALYKQAQLLVLDEATSALDNRTEAEVMEAIEELDRGLTVILIAHRLSTVRNCDRIVVLEKGCISGIGRYEELVSSHSGFKAMANQP
ncbi:ABC transporter ATP-binding protein [Synechococcus sp. Cruz CV-v-12]|uniref:ABC transporter ATP-binding protein n=1 Tax=Synechococcus sp. Cruz CV-v-12 TaxID=2823728 RepID=UPI0020CDD80D|nr:ABC transporter ATP-binding protein [Synechococcus sp. Cruz CV-v-12]